MPDTLTPTEYLRRRRYLMLRTEGGYPSNVAFEIMANVSKADRIGLDFEANGPFEVEYRGRTFEVATPDDSEPDTSYLEDVPEEDHPEGFYGLVVKDVATGEVDSLWGIDFDGRTIPKLLASQSYLWTVFEDMANGILERVYGRTCHG